MLLDQELLRFIFGLKLRSIRLEKGMPLKSLARATGLSPSYINEIEKGKKYPKSDKILLLAETLGVPFDDLISLRLKAELRNVTRVLEKNLLKGLPFDVFGVPAQSFFELIAARPQQVCVLIGTLLELARAHDISVEEFFAATLRSYLDMNRNFFPEIEDQVRSAECPLPRGAQAEEFAVLMAQGLRERHGYELRFLDFSTLSLDLRGLFYFHVAARTGKIFAVNSQLTSREKAFVLAKELGHATLGLKERSSSSHLGHLDSYEMLVNNLKASYFASALLVPLDRFASEVHDFLARDHWDAAAFTQWVMSYPGPVPAFFHRLAQVLPNYCDLPEIFLIRVSFDPISRRFHMVNELHLSKLHGPHRVKSEEHYCRRWISSVLLEQMACEGDLSGYTGAQRSTFNGSNSEYLCISSTYRPDLEDHRLECSTLGIMVNAASRSQVRFLNDEALVKRDVGDTCEQCGILDCEVRQAPPRQHERRTVDRRTQEALEAVIELWRQD